MILGVSFDSPEANRKFKEKYGFPYDLLSDPSRSVGVAYGAADDASAKSAKRISYVIGTDGRIEIVYETVKAAEHPEQVLADLG